MCYISSGYGSYGGYGGYDTGRCYPNPYGGNSGPGYQGNISDAHTGGGHLGWRGRFFGGPSWQPNEGYAIDQNRNGRYDRGRDGVLVFDTNRDGRYDKRDVQNTNNMMQAVAGHYDFNNDVARVPWRAFARRLPQLALSPDGYQSRRPPQHR